MELSLTEETSRSRHNGQSSSLRLLPPTDFGGTPTPFGFASRLRRETLLQRWSHQIPLSGNPLRLRSAPFGASCHNALNPTPFGFASRLRRETLLQRWSHQIPLSGNPHQVLAPQGTTLGRTGSLRVHQSPTAGNPLRSCHNAGNPRKALLSAALDSPQGAALRSNFSQNSKLSRIFGNG